MATLRKIAGLIIVVLFFFVASVPAASANTPAAAYSACSTKLSWALANENSSYKGSTCQFISYPSDPTHSGYYLVGGPYGTVGCGGEFGEIPGSYADCLTTSPDNLVLCSSMPDSNGTAQALDRTSAASVQMCDTTSGYGAGNGSGCVATFQPGTGIANSAGGYVFAGTWHSSGTGCTPNPDGTFTPDGSSVPQAPPVGPTKPPVRACGGGSCVDPSSGQACIVDQAGHQFCTPTGSASPTATPNCYSDGSSATLCVGTPNAPPAPNPPVSDPATQITSSDTYRASTSSSQTTTVVNVFNTSGGTTSSGQSATDLGSPNGGQQNGQNPAHSSSAGGNGTYQGGTDCNTPPVCTGDAVLCGASRAQWSTTCQVHKDLAGTSPAPSASTLGSSGAYDQGSLWVSSGAGNTVGDQANAGNYDQSGFGYSVQCPMKDLTVPLGSYSFAVPFSEGCVIGPWLRAIVIAFALYAGAKITAGGVG